MLVSWSPLGGMNAPCQKYHVPRLSHLENITTVVEFEQRHHTVLKLYFPLRIELKAK